jgi:hypothetical protein
VHGLALLFKLVSTGLTFRIGGRKYTVLKIAEISVADPGCLSRIPDPDFYPPRIPDLGSWIPDPKTATKEWGEKNLLSYLFM